MSTTAATAPVSDSEPPSEAAEVGWLSAPSSSGSVIKTLSKLIMSVPANRSCADCRSALVDSSQVHASFSPITSKVLDHPSSSHQYNSFQSNHVKFAPPGMKPGNTSDPDGPSPVGRRNRRKIPSLRDNDAPIDPALVAAEYVGGHGVFVCAPCAAAHKLLGSSIAVVHAVQDATAWTPSEVNRMVAAGGNARATQVLEAYLPTLWNQAKRPHPHSSIADRLIFIRAKYEALAFCLPPSGPLAQEAWHRIYEYHHPEWRGLWEADLESLADLEINALASSSSSVMFAPLRVGPSSTSSAATVARHHEQEDVEGDGEQHRQLPDRLVDYFCVVSASEHLDRRMMMQQIDLSQLSSPEHLYLNPQIADCYPTRHTYTDTEFPEHVSTFVFPEGCQPSLTAQPPFLFTFVFTSSSNDRLYGCALRIYDQAHDVDDLRRIVQRSGYMGNLPSWLDPRHRAPHRSAHHSAHQDVAFFPTCLVILSHYPFFDLWRKFLLQLYRIVLVEAPLPVERYLANFCCEVPLPPPGKLQVRMGLTVNETWTIERPPENQLPMANFSYKPLFSCLSVGNVMVVMGCLMQETRVALLSRHYALLTPVAEALLSLLFPFRWQGTYLPVLPYSLLEFLDAPVPFLVGLHARYLTQVEASQRPAGVVLVDLDRDVVHLGYDDDSQQPRRTPSLPERQAMKLKAKLDEFAASVYAIPDTGKAGSITTGHGMQLPYADREPYAHVNSLEIASPALRRKELLSSTDKAYRDNELLVPISGFLTEHGQYYEREQLPPSSSSSERRFRFLRRNRKASSSPIEEAKESVRSSIDPENLLDMHEPPGFSTSEIRGAFLRFFVSLFRDYRQHMSTSSFNTSSFLGSLNLQGSQLEFVQRLLQTQMFERFRQERIENPDDPEVLFFDESITAKINRSKKAAFATMGRGKKETAFLNDKSAAVTETYAPPAPSTLGLPDDGRSYHYSSFPKLDADLFGKVRPPRAWKAQRQSSVRATWRASGMARANEQAILFKAMAPVLKTPSALVSATKRGIKNLESAISALSSPFAAPAPNPTEGRPVESDAVSDITVSTAFDLQKDIMSTAEEVVLNARRKQAILLEIIIKLQCYCRMFLAKQCALQMRINSNPEKKALVDMQAQLERRNKAAVAIQSWWRSTWLRHRYFRLLSAIVRCQASIRTQRVRRAFHLLIQAIARIQAQARGYLVQKVLSIFLSGVLEAYKKHLFLLWQRAHTPLSYRSQFWPILQQPGFVRLYLGERELQRVWRELRIQIPPSNNSDQQSLELARMAQKLGLSSRVYIASLKINQSLAALLVVGRGSSSLRGSGGSRSHPDTVATREISERMQIYERLSTSISVERRGHYFTCFRVAHNDKLKKVAVAESIWHDFELANDSTKLMMDLFPELKTSANIQFVEPSKKTCRRFRASGSLPLPLDPSLSAYSLLSDRIHMHVAEVTRALLAKSNDVDHRPAQISPRSPKGVPSLEKEERLVVMKKLMGAGQDLSSTHREDRKETSPSILAVANGRAQASIEHSTAATSLPGDNFWDLDGSADSRTRRAESKPSYPGQNFWVG